MEGAVSEAEDLEVCRESMTAVRENGMRPGYDCMCSGCRVVAAHRLARGEKLADPVRRRA